MLLQQLVNGVMLGSAYSLIAIGYTLIFGVLNLLHLAHGEVFMIGAFIGLTVVLLVKANIYLALLGAMAGAALLGVLVELIAFRPLGRKELHLSPLVTTIAMSVILQELAVKIFGGEQVGFPETVKVVNYQIGRITVSSVQMLIIGVAVVLMVVLSLFIQRTKMGKGMRATSESPTTARLLGVNVNTVIVATFAVSSALAGAAGVLVGLSYNAISPFIGLNMGLKGLVVMFLGGMGNVNGAMVGGLLLGLIEVLSVAYLASSYRDAFAFAVLIAILLFRPTGIFGLRVQTGR